MFWRNVADRSKTAARDVFVVVVAVVFVVFVVAVAVVAVATIVSVVVAYLFIEKNLYVYTSGMVL